MRQLSAAHINQLNTKLVDKAARLIEKNCPEARPEIKDALLQYSLNYANAYGSDWSLEWDLGNRQRGRGSGKSQNIRVIVFVCR